MKMAAQRCPNLIGDLGLGLGWVLWYHIISMGLEQMNLDKSAMNWERKQVFQQIKETAIDSTVTILCMLRLKEIQRAEPVVMCAIKTI